MFSLSKKWEKMNFLKWILLQCCLCCVITLFFIWTTALSEKTFRSQTEYKQVGTVARDIFDSIISQVSHLYSVQSFKLQLFSLCFPLLWKILKFYWGACAIQLWFDKVASLSLKVGCFCLRNQQHFAVTQILF